MVFKSLLLQLTHRIINRIKKGYFIIMNGLLFKANVILPDLIKS